MIFADIPFGAAVFVDANTFVYCLFPDPALGPPCAELIDRIERQELQGYSSAGVLNEVVHRLMTLEAAAVFGWALTGMAQRLRRHPTEVQRLNRYRLAIDVGLRMLPITEDLVSRAADVSRQIGLLSNDALVVAVMRDQGLTQLASNDADFDRVPGLTRYAPA
jgi:predicted nucleic acid-binding protein